eukprot:jgi/Ulvmu1/3444/UM016_0063.1
MALSGLEELQLGRGKKRWCSLAVTWPQVLLEACAGLPQLRVLGLGLEGLQREEVVAVLPRLSRLTALRLPADVFGRGGDGGGDCNDINKHVPHCKVELL